MRTPLLPSSLARLVEQISRLPGVGEKTALRYSLSLLRDKRLDPREFIRALEGMLSHVGTCLTCYFWTDSDVCALCSDTQRDPTRLCVVRDCPDILAIERARAQPWRYHILQGLLSPLQGLGPKNIRLDSLIRRLEGGEYQELILALDATIEGDATSLYIRDLIKEKFPSIRLMRTASGLPAGSSVEYLDSSTLERALFNRLPFDV